MRGGAGIAASRLGLRALCFDGRGGGPLFSRARCHIHGIGRSRGADLCETDRAGKHRSALLYQAEIDDPETCYGAAAGGHEQVAWRSSTAALRQFEQGLFNLPAALAMMLGALSLFALTAIWLPTGTAVREKLLVSFLIVLFFSVLAFASSHARVYVDVTENRRNSFNPADEVALRRMQSPLFVWIYLSPEDSRLKEMEANVLGKLRRTVPHLEIRYEDTSGQGLFGSVPDERYGLIIYEYEGKRAESRSNSPREILPLVHELSGTKVTPEKEPDYRGYPLVADATGYGVWFYGILPAFILLAWQGTRRPTQVISKLETKN